MAGWLDLCVCVFFMFGSRLEDLAKGSEAPSSPYVNNKHFLVRKVETLCTSEALRNGILNI
jgi:hypothetical protein